MRVVVTDTVYEGFLAHHYRARPELVDAPYAVQRESLLDASFGTSDAYTVHLRELGHEAVNLIVNCAPLQLAWAREHGFARLTRKMRSLLPTRAGIALRRALLQAITEAQIADSHPDVLFIHDMFSMTTAGLQRQRRAGRLLVTQIASPLPPPAVYSGFDLVLSSFHHFVRRFRMEGVESEYFRLGFYERIGERLERQGVDVSPSSRRDVDVAFVGGIDPRVHSAGTAFLERVARNVAIDVWGYGAGALPADSPLLTRYHGEAWGLDMYRALASTRIALNRHIDVAEGQANNMRLYEATGMGALVMTEAAANLSELFEPGVEIVAYESESDLIEKLRYYLEHEDERLAIALAGRRRTMANHTYRARMVELAALLEERLARRGAPASAAPDAQAPVVISSNHAV